MTAHDINPKRILIVKLSSIGDVIMALPVAKALRRHYPDAYIAWAVEDKSKDVLKGNPYIDDVILIKRDYGSNGILSSSIGVIKGALQAQPSIRNGGFDIAIDLQGLLKSAFIAKASGARIRLGFNNAREGAAMFYTKRLKTSRSKSHGPLDYLSMLSLLDITSDDVDMKVFYTNDDADYVDNMLNEFRNGVTDIPVVALCAPTTMAQKHWTEEGWARLADILAKQYGLFPVFMGSSADRPLIERIRSMMTVKSASAAGMTTLNQASALIHRCAFVVAVDTGLLHMAVGAGRPSVGIFGPTAWGHLAKKPNFRVIAGECGNSPCGRHPVCKNFECMASITPENVIQVASDWLLSDYYKDSQR